MTLPVRKQYDAGLESDVYAGGSDRVLPTARVGTEVLGVSVGRPPPTRFDPGQRHDLDNMR